MNRLAGRVAIVTGASSGIGRSIAQRFSEEGATVVLADVTSEAIEGGTPTHELIGRAGRPAELGRTDMGVAADVHRLADHVVERHGQIDVVVNNAAISVWKPMLDTSEEEWDRVFAINVKGVFLLTKRAIEHMRRQEPRDGVRGRIVNISSQHGMISAPEDCAYGTSKSAVVYMTRQVAADYAADGIICNAVAPGKIFTGKGGRETDERWLAYWRSRVPFFRHGEPRDIANAALFLASDEATFITGENLMVDGGWSAN
jgi:NAD(P)-dependent dehydrogenase (short-subunit alcohol dehydrogenase family)